VNTARRLPDATVTATAVICALVAAVEAVAYLVLARAVVRGGPPAPVLLAAGVSLLVTVLGAHAGFLGAARYAGRLYAALGEGLVRARLGWFTTSSRALVTTAAGRSVPALMALPAHHLQFMVPAVVVPPVLVGGLLVLVSPVAAGLVALSLLLSLGLHLWSQYRLLRADAGRADAGSAADEATLSLVDHLDLAVTTVGPTRTLASLEPGWRRAEDALATTTRATVPAGVTAAVANRLPVVGVLVWSVVTTPTAPVLLAAVVLALRAGAPLSQLALSGLTLGELSAARRTLEEVVGAPRLESPGTVPAPVPDPERDRDTAGVRHGLVLTGVTSRGSDPVTAVVEPGSVVRVTGPSGAGKSTLLGLLMRFEDPETGSVTLDGTPLPAIALPELMRRFAFVPQEPTLFSGSLADNVTMGAKACPGSGPGSDPGDALATALSVAALDDLVSGRPDGVLTDTGSRGSALSGGQQQRVALARAVHRILTTDADYLVLDEPTAALDGDTASRVIDGLLELRRSLAGASGRRLGVIVVSHRPEEDWHEDARITLGRVSGPPSPGRGAVAR
jgi:ABC-type multidrug transport system fused ATPase/permease subunit